MVESKRMAGWLTSVLALICLKTPIEVLAAGNMDSTNKHAWTENVGWANVSPSNGGVTVHFDGTSGYLTGVAWGENIGWVKLGHSSGGPYANTTSNNWGVNVAASGTLSGYAWGENVGWINFGHAQCDAAINPGTGEFSGNAWGENVGWIRFKGLAPDYSVRTLAFGKQTQGTPNWWLTNHAVTEDYDDGDGVPAWKEYTTDTDPTNAASYFYITVISNLQPVTVSFPSSARRYYTLQRCDDLKSGNWTNVEAQTDIPGAGGRTALQDVTATNRQFYRVEVSVTP